MNTTISIPADVLKLIEGKKQQLRAEQAAKEEAAKREQDELFAKGSQIYMEHRAQAIEKLPEWVREYVRPALLSIDNYVRIGQGWDQLKKYYLTIDIPGLATIDHDTSDMTYRTGTAEWNGTAEDEPWFSESGGWKKDLDYVLCMAEKQMQKHQENLVKWEAAKEEASRRYNEQEAFEQGADERRQELEKERELKAAREQREELYTFDVLKNDAVALHLVKAFLLIQNERSHFEQRLQDADETLYSIETRWSRRAEELRRQADEAERRAADERSRLQDDLDDAEAKLKKAQRGW